MAPRPWNISERTAEEVGRRLQGPLVGKCARAAASAPPNAVLRRCYLSMPLQVKEWYEEELGEQKIASTITQQQLRVEIAALTAELSSSIEQSVQLLQVRKCRWRRMLPRLKRDYAALKSFAGHICTIGLELGGLVAAHA